MPEGTALVTGASSGIGEELARICAARGYQVVLVARRADELERVARSLSGRGRVLSADLADPAAPRTIVDALGSVAPDILINNAGFGLRGAYSETDWEAEARMIQVNITALACLTKLFLPGMLRRGSGRIMNVASTAGFVPGPYMSVYYASKAFVVSFSEALANELKGSGVTVTALCPGPTRTNFGSVAGMASTRLFQSPAMRAADVAREGFEAMMKGRPVAIAGSRNRWLMRLTRFAPRRIVADAVAKLNT